ncbi:hypothetical protein [uncultured Ferrimonas sp.]|uniref:STAS/SEC14 domain-containing protein n=1 Tax=uncultured Ferrimonas sp. TaxID=432640 RepID=UPI0026253F45|nr:hypothetical protein [uncultured Ferrimonas sp.]
MFQVKLDHCAGVITIESGGEISAQQLQQARLLLAPYLRQRQHLQGLLWCASAMPRWQHWQDVQATVAFLWSLATISAQLAIVTNSCSGDLLAKLGALWQQPKVRHFAAVQRQQAKQWLLR